LDRGEDHQDLWRNVLLPLPRKRPVRSGLPSPILREVVRVLTA
jgi:hypothetical protein